MSEINELKGQTVLVTGGAGFIGSHLCDRLIELGAKVVCFDNLFTGKKENIAHLNENPNFTFILGDANDYKNLHVEVFQKNKIDYVFHYAAVLGVKRVSEDPLLVLPDIVGIENILKLAKEFSVKKIVYASSSEAYGHSGELPLREDGNKDLECNQADNVHLYALVKLMGEKMMKIYNDRFGVPTCSLRFFNVFGPRQESSAYGFVVGVFIDQIIKDEQPTILGNGYQTRDFIFVKDNVETAIRALIYPESNGQVINVGIGRQITILDLAEKLIRISGKDLKPTFLPARQYEIKYRSPDVTKMQTLLKTTLPDNLDDNLKITYEYYLGRKK